METTERRVAGARLLGAIALLLAAFPIGARADVTYEWNEVSPDLAINSAYEIVSHPIDGRRLLMSGTFAIGGGSFFSGTISSIDGGSNWTQVGAAAWLQDVSAHPGLPGTLFAEVRGNITRTTALGTFLMAPSPGRVYRSDDFGDSWTLVNTAGQDGMSFVPFGTDPSDVSRIFGLATQERSCAIFASCRYDQEFGIGLSRDGGRTWELSPGLAEVSANQFQVIDVKAPVPADPKRMFAVTKEGAFVTRDGATTWSRFELGAIRNVRAIRADPRRSNVLYAIRQPVGGVDGDFLRSDDEGASWTSVLSYHNSANNQVLPELAVDPARPNEVWLFGLESGVYHSSNGGTGWNNVGFVAANPNVVVRQLVVNPADPGVVLLVLDRTLYRGTPSLPRDPVIVEFRYDPDRFWNAVTGGEASSQDYRMEPAQVRRTGLRFGAWRADDAPAGALGSCRFQGNPAQGQHSRFITLQGSECEAVKRDPAHVLEGENEFFAIPIGPRGCVEGLVTVKRFFNNQADKNHRYVTDPAVGADLRTRGWIEEGIAFCARPLGSNE